MPASRLILPYPCQPVDYQEYDPRAPIVAQLISDLVRQYLPKVSVEHIGRTAVLGCAGRGAIDLMILHNDEPIVSILSKLDTLGFEWDSDITLSMVTRRNARARLKMRDQSSESTFTFCRTFIQQSLNIAPFAIACDSSHSS